MNDRGLTKLLDYLRRDAVDPASDGELLSRYVATRDEGAFEQLVRRHGPLVLGTARRVLRDGHAAEDVFQAAFLALSRKAHSLKHGGAIAGWLHQVTLRAALRARPKPPPTPATLSYVDDASRTVELSELRSALDEEVARLPERQRLAVLLCYLGGKTIDEASRQLDCPRGTILSRLASARDRLQRRLTRRGYGMPAAGIATLWAADTVPAVTSNLIALTLRTAGPVAVRLTEGVLHAMVMTKVKVAATVILASGLLVVGVGRGLGPTAVQAQAEKPAPAKPPIRLNLTLNKEADEALLRLLKERLDAATGELELRFDEFKVGKGTLVVLLDVSIAKRDAALALTTDVNARAELHKAHVDLTGAIVRLNQARHDAGAIKLQDLLQSRRHWLSAQIAMAQDKPGTAK